MSKKRNKNYNNDGLNQIQPMHKNNNYFYFFIQIIFSFLLTYQIINNNIYQSYNTMLQLVSYLIIYNLTFLIFYNFQYHILQQKTLNIMYWVLGLSIIYVYIISYYPVLELNGDNAAYLSRAKSIMEGKGFRNLWLPKEPFESTLKGIGFSLLNIPFVFIFGLNNYIGLNLLEFFSVFIGLFFMYKFFKNKLDKDKLFLLIIIVALYSQIIHFTFNQMTESASFALMFITMYLAEKYINNDEKFKLKKIVFIFLISAIAFFSFTVREAMVAIIITIPLYLLVHKKWKETIIFGLFTIIYFLGYFFLSNHLKSLNDLYQLIEPSAKIFSQSATGEHSFFEHYSNLILTDFKSLNIKSIVDSLLVLSQKIVGDPDRYQYDSILLNILVIIIFFIAIYKKIKDKSVLGLYDMSAIVLILVVIAFWGSQTDYMVFSRYYYSLIPLVFYYFILGIEFIAQKIKSINLIGIVYLIIFSFSLLYSFNMNLSAVYSSHNPYPPAIQNFINACEWIKSNTPQDAIIANRKNTLGYIWANRKSLAYFDGDKYTRYDNYSKQFEIDTIDYYKRNKIDYIILDAFSPDAYYKILPVIKNNMPSFVLRYKTSQPETYVLKFTNVKP